MKKFLVIGGFLGAALIMFAADSRVSTLRTGSGAPPNQGNLGDIYYRWNGNLFYGKTNGPLQSGGWALISGAGGGGSDTFNANQFVVDSGGSQAILSGAPLTNAVLTTPTIASFAEANHNHANDAGAGTLPASSIASGQIAVANGGTGSSTAEGGFNALGAAGVSKSGNNLTVVGSVTAGSITSTGNIDLTGSGVGGVAVWDDAGLQHHRTAAPTDITTSINEIQPAAPFNGLAKYTVSATTNMTKSAAVAGTDYSAPITLREEDGSPTLTVTTLRVPNGSLTDNGSGSGSIAISGGGGTDLWTAYGINRSRVHSSRPNGTTTLSSLGDSLATFGAAFTASSADANQPVGINCPTTASTSGDDGGAASAGVQYRFTDNLDVIIHARLVETNAVRAFIGLSSLSGPNTVGATDPASGHLLGFRYVAADSVNWFLITKDGTTINATDTGIQANTSWHTFGIRFDPTVSATGYIDGTAVGGGVHTTQLPTSTSGGRTIVGIETQEAAQKTIRFFGSDVIVYP